MSKLTAYILMVVGVVIIALPILPFTKDLIAKTHIASYIIIIIGLAVMAFGFVSMKPKKSKARQEAEEVPIYHGNKIVGYRKAEK